MRSYSFSHAGKAAWTGFLRSFFPILCSVSLSGCFGAGDVGQAEVSLHLRNSDDPIRNAACIERSNCTPIDVGPTYTGRVNYAAALAGEYMRLADRASQTEDLAALGIISAAGVGAGALLYDAPLNLLKGAGLAAGMTAAGRNYAKPGESAQHLLNAAEGMLCIASAAGLAPATVRTTGAELVDLAINRVRLDLRRKLQRQAPSYRDIVDAVKTVDANKSTNLKGLVETTPGLSSALDTCVSKTVINVTTS
jgi:hypothetical protein